MRFRTVVTPLLLLVAAAFFTCSAEEDPSYEPFDRVRPTPPPKRAVSISDSVSAPAPKKVESVKVQPTPPVYARPAEVPYTPPPTVGTPAGPKVKYYLNGKPVYEGDPDPVAEAKAAEARAKELAARNIPAVRATERPVAIPPQRPRSVYEETPKGDTPASVRLDFSNMAPPSVGKTQNYPAPSVSAPAYTAPATPAGPRVKYILDGKPVYEGDPDPVAGMKNGSVAPNANGDFSANAVLSRQAQQPPVSAGNSAALLDDLTADKPNTKDGATGGVARPAEAGGVVLEDMPAPGQVGSRAKKCYDALAELKKLVESLSRSMDNRGKENAQMIHSSEVLLSTINDMAAIWPTSEAFLDVCTAAKRSALIFNTELTNVPWTWTRVRWSHEAMVKDVKRLRSYAKLQAEAEPRPVPVVLKDGNVVYVDAQDANIDPITARREAMAKAARAELTRLKENAANREDRKKNKLTTDLDGNSTAP